MISKISIDMSRLQSALRSQMEDYAYKMASEAREEIIEEARTQLGSSAERYIRAVSQPERNIYGGVSVFLEKSPTGIFDLPQMLERGMAGYDMRRPERGPGLLRGGSQKYGRGGMSYVNVPIKGPYGRMVRRMSSSRASDGKWRHPGITAHNIFPAVAERMRERLSKQR
jgi:hypothetical protein